MEPIIYETLKDFKENYFVDFSLQGECGNILQYLSMLKKKYTQYIDHCRSLHDKNDTLSFRIIETLDDLEDYMPYHSHFVLKNDLWEDFNPSHHTEDDFIRCPELLANCIDLGDEEKPQHGTLYEKISLYFSLKKESETKEAEFYEKTTGLYETVKYICDQIDIEKNILLRFQDLPKKGNSEKNIDLNSWELFNHIRYNDVGYLERSRYLKDITENYHPDLLKSLLKDLEFYLFIEKEQKEAEYDSGEIAEAIKECEAKDLPIPRLEIIPHQFLTDRQKETREADKKQSGKKETISVDLEGLLFPFEFFCLYEFQRTIIRKIKELSPKEKETQIDIDISELKISKTKSIALLHHTGILDFLRSQYPTISDRQLAGFFEFITRESITIRNQSSQFTSDKRSVKYPIKNKKDIEDLDRLLVSFGMKEKRVF